MCTSVTDLCEAEYLSPQGIYFFVFFFFLFCYLNLVAEALDCNYFNLIATFKLVAKTVDMSFDRVFSTFGVNTPYLIKNLLFSKNLSGI